MLKMIRTGTLFGSIETSYKNYSIILILQTTKGLIISGTITKYFLIYFDSAYKERFVNQEPKKI